MKKNLPTFFDIYFIISVGIFYQIFVAFSEYLNFMSPPILKKICETWPLGPKFIEGFVKNGKHFSFHIVQSCDRDKRYINISLYFVPPKLLDKTFLKNMRPHQQCNINLNANHENPRLDSRL